MSQSGRERFVQSFGQAYCDAMPQLSATMAETLRYFGCEEIYGMGGDYVAPLVRSLNARFELVPSASELHAGYSACASAELGHLGVCLVTYTVGSMPCVAAAALAMAERLPVVFLSGAPGELEAGGTGLHHTLCRSDSWDFSFDNAMAAFRGLGARAERLQGARNAHQPSLAGEQFYELVRHAYRRREPVFIEIPRDLVDTPTQRIRMPEVSPTESLRASSLDGLTQIADHIEAKLRSSEHPLLYFGEKVRFNARLRDAILTFCRRTQMPFVSSFFCKGVLGHDDPLSLGNYNGVFSPDHVRDYVETKADFVLELGTSTISQDLSTAFETGTNVIEHFENKVAIIGSSARERDEVALIEALLERDLPVFARGWSEATPSVPDPESELTWLNLMDTLSHIECQSDRPWVYLPEVGNSFFASFSLRTRRAELGRSWLTNPWYGAMGTSLPYARTVARTIKRLGLKDVPVVLTGDGGFHMQLNELVHFQRDGLHVVIVMMRNNIFHLGKLTDSPIYESCSAYFDAAQLIAAYGGTYQRCDRAGALASAMTTACQAPGVHLIEVPVSDDEALQCREIHLLNTYIRARAGQSDAMQAWERAVARK